MTSLLLQHKARLDLMARTLYRELKSSGFSDKDAIVMATHLLDCVIQAMRARRE